MTVFIAKENKDTKQAIRRIIEHFKDNLDLSKGVFLKPNIVFPVKEKSGQITRHKVVRGVIEVLREIEPKVEIVVGEGTAAGSNPQENFRISGYTDLAKELNVPLLDLDQSERKIVNWKYGIIKLPKIIFEKVYINLPILKRSSAAGVSGAMKNQKGLLEPKMKKAFHKLGLHEPIARLNERVQPALTILDGHNFFRENVFLSGDNTCEVDRIAIKALGAETPEYIKIFRDLMPEITGFAVLGDRLDNIKPRAIDQTQDYKRFLRLRLWSNPQACSMCRFVLIDLKRVSLKNVICSNLLRLKLFLYSIKSAEVIFGKNPEYRSEFKNVICFGDCTKKIAEDNNYLHVPGCPPKKEDILKYL